MSATSEDTAPSYATIRKRAEHFKIGKESLQDDDRCGRPTTITTEENMQKVVMDDRCLTVIQVANTDGISFCTMN